MYGSSRGGTPAQTLTPTYCIYKALWMRFKGHTSSQFPAASVRSEYRIFGYEFYENHIFHHVTAFTFSFTEFPVKTQLVV